MLNIVQLLKSYIFIKFLKSEIVVELFPKLAIIVQFLKLEIVVKILKPSSVTEFLISVRSKVLYQSIARDSILHRAVIVSFYCTDATPIDIS